MAHVDAFVAQQAFRARNDDGSETGATWKALVDTSWTQAADEVFRLRVMLEETAGGAANNYSYLLEYSINGGTFTAVDATGSAVRATASAFVAAAAPTTQQIGAGSFVAGEFDGDASTSNISLTSQQTEMEYGLTLDSSQISDGDTITFRCTNGGALLNGYNSTPTLTASVAAAPITGTMATQEGGTDSFTGLGDVTVGGTMSLTEGGSDSFAGSGSLGAEPTGIAKAKTMANGGHWALHDPNSLYSDAGTTLAVVDGEVNYVSDSWGSQPLTSGVGGGVAPRRRNTSPSYIDHDDVSASPLSAGTSIGNTALFADAADSFFVSAAFYAASGDKNGALIAKAVGTSDQRDFQITVSDGAINVVCRGLTTTFSTLAFDNAWHIIQVWWDGSNMWAEIDSNAAVSIPLGTAAQDTAEDILIGARTEAGLGFWRDGFVGDVLIADNELDAQTREEVKQEIGGFYGVDLTATTSGTMAAVETGADDFTANGDNAVSALTGIDAALNEATAVWWDLTDNTSVYSDAGITQANEFDTVAYVTDSGDAANDLEQTDPEFQPQYENNRQLKYDRDFGRALVAKSNTVGTTTMFADAGQQFTVAVPFRKPSDSTSGSAMLTNSNDTTGGRQFFLQMGPSAADIRVRLRETLTTLTEADIGVTMSDGNWHVAVVKWDGAEATLEVDNTGEHILSVGTTAEELDAFLILGARSGGSAGTYGFYWRDELGSPFIADSALTHQRRQEIAKELLAPFGVTLSITADISGTMAVQESGSDGFTASGSVVSNSIAGTLSVQEAGADDFTAVVDVIVEGFLATQEAGADTALSSGTIAISGTLSAQETGLDDFSASGEGSSSGTMVVQETEVDDFIGIGDVIVDGIMSADEAGGDIASGSGSVEVTGSLSAQETGQDSFLASAEGSSSGTLASQESGTDTFTGTVSVSVEGALTPTETGNDDFTGIGDVTIDGILAVQEIGQDDFTGFVEQSSAGTMSVQESGVDNFTASGTIPATGSLTVQEAGADDLMVSGTVSLSGTMSVQEAGVDDFYAEGFGPNAGTMAALETGKDDFTASGESNAKTGIAKMKETSGVRGLHFPVHLYDSFIWEDTAKTTRALDDDDPVRLVTSDWEAYKLEETPLNSRAPRLELVDAAGHPAIRPYNDQEISALRVHYQTVGATFLYAHPNDEFFISIAVNAATGTPDGTIIAKAGATSGSRMFQIRSTTNGIVVELRGATTTYTYHGHINDGSWHVIQLSWFGATETGTLEVDNYGKQALNVGTAIDEDEYIILGARTTAAVADRWQGRYGDVVICDYPFDAETQQQVKVEMGGFYGRDLSGTGAASGTLAITEQSKDDATLIGAVEVSGSFALTETYGDDIFVGSGDLDVNFMEAREVGQDFFLASGSLGAFPSEGTLAAQEEGDDLWSATASNPINGSFSWQEPTGDTISSPATGEVLVEGALATQEVGSDTANMVSSLDVVGTLVVQEVGSDTATGSGSSAGLTGIAQAKAIASGGHWPVHDNANFLWEDSAETIAATDDNDPVTRITDDWGTTYFKEFSGNYSPPRLELVDVTYPAVRPADFGNGFYSYELNTNVIGNTKLFADASEKFLITVAVNSGDHVDNGTIIAKCGSDGALRQFQLSMMSTGLSINLRGANTQYEGSGSLSDGQWHIIQVWWDGAKAYVEVDNDGASELNVGTAAAEDTEVIMLFGRTKNDSHYRWAGHIGDVLIADSSLDATTRQQVKQEIGGFYGLDLSGSGAAQGSMSAREAGADDFTAAGDVAVAGALAAAEGGADAFAATAQATVTGTLDAAESGADIVAITGTTVTRTGTMAVQEAGADSFAAEGVLLITAQLAVAETGSDLFTGSASPVIQGVFAAQEAGSDAAAADGTVLISGSLSVQEPATDTLAGSGAVSVVGSMSGNETGADQMEASGGIAATGTLAAQETGQDTFTGSLNTPVAGELVAVEGTVDTFTGSGAVTVMGALETQDTGSDTFIGNSTLTATGALTAREAGADDFTSSGLVPVTGFVAAVEGTEDWMSATLTTRVTGGMAAVEPTTDTPLITGEVAVQGSGAAQEVGTDDFSATGGTFVGSVMEVQEQGEDTLVGSGYVTVTITAPVREEGSDGMTATGSVRIRGEAGVVEVSGDISRIFGEVRVLGQLSVTEPAKDTFTATLYQGYVFEVTDTPARRTVAVEGQVRVVTVEAETRTATVEAQDRTVVVPKAELRMVG